MPYPKDDRHFLDFERSLNVPSEALSKNFFRALGWGTLAGGLPFMVFTLPSGIMAALSIGSAGLLIAVLPLLISLLGTSILMFAVELPLTAILRSFDLEKTLVYAPISMIAGAAIPIIVAWLNGWGVGVALFFAVFGMIAGTTAGTVWGNWRESLFAPPNQPRFLRTVNPAPYKA